MDSDDEVCEVSLGADLYTRFGILSLEQEKRKTISVLNLQEHCKESFKKVGRVDWRSKAPHHCVVIAQVKLN